MTWPPVPPPPYGEPPTRPHGEPRTGPQAQPPGQGPPSPDQGLPPPNQPYPPPPPIQFEHPTEVIEEVVPKRNILAIVAFVLSLFPQVLLSAILGIIALIRTRDPGRGGRGLAIASLVISAIWAVIIVLMLAKIVPALEGSVSTAEMKVGDCLVGISKKEQVKRLRGKPCAEPHAAEVYAVLTMPDGAYPGDKAVTDFKNNCNGELEKYAPKALADPAIGIYVLSPTEENWDEGDRKVICIATFKKRTGSIKA